MLSFITWSADPNLISSPISIRWYGLMFAIGFWIGLEIVTRFFKHEGAPEKWIGSLFIYVVVATIIGSRLGHVLFYDWAYYSQHPLDIFKIWEGGLASHGGTIGIILAIFLYSHFVTKRSSLWTFDRLVIPVALVGAMIRFGNLMNHEIYGDVTEMPWGFRFIQNISSWQQGADPIYSLPSHPTQIYESACYLLLFALLMWMYWHKNAQCRPGLIFGTFLLGIFTPRFFIEYIKNVQEPWEVGLRASCGMDMGQILSIPFILVGLILVVRSFRRPAVHIDFPNKFPDTK